MLPTLTVLVASWLLLSACGWLLLAPLERRRRDRLLPVAPLLGAVLLVVVLHDATFLVSVRLGLLLVAAVLVVLGVVAHRRDKTWWRPSRVAGLGLVLVAAVSILPAALALAPSAAVGDSRVVQPSENNDAFYYVSVADWLQDHAATDVPMIGKDPAAGGVPPSYGPAKASLEHGIRIGQEMVQASISTVLGLSNVATWYPLTTLWLLLIPAAGYALGVLLRVGAAVGITAGLLVSTASLTFYQLASQNSDSLLGLSLAFLALGAVADCLEEDPLLPRPVAGMMLTAWVGTYSELLPVVAPAMVLMSVVQLRRRRPTPVRAAAAVLAWAVVLAPLPWIRSVSSLIQVGGLANEPFPSAFMKVSPWLAASRFLGLTSFDSSAVSGLLPVFLLVGLVGLMAALILSSHRWMWYPLLVMGLLLAIYAVHRHRPYTQQRLVQLWAPFVIVMAVVGCYLVGREVKSRWRRPWVRPAASGLSVVLVVVFVAANVHTVSSIGMVSEARSRHVDSSFAQAAGWVRQVGGRHGGRVMVVSLDFFDQLWITDALRHEEDVSYPFLYNSYQYQSSYWGGGSRRWVLVDTAVQVDAQRAVVVRQNARFRLLDLARGAAVITFPGDQIGGGSVVVVRSPSTPNRVVLTGNMRPRTSTDPLLTGLGRRLKASALRPHAVQVPVTFSDGQEVERVIPRGTVRTFDVTGVRLAR